jgi:hypothetical protein
MKVIDKLGGGVLGSNVLLRKQLFGLVKGLELSCEVGEGGLRLGHG